MTKVSIVVPIYNVEQYIAESLDSLAKQTERDIEVICVDDGSTDRSAEIAQSYCSRDRRFQLIRQKNLGTVVARKRGVDKATGEYVLFVDPDDMLKPEACEKLYAIAKDRRCDILQFGVDILETENRSEKRRAASAAYFNPEPVEFRGREILTAAYRDHRLPFNVIFRLFGTKLVRAAFKNIPDVFSVNETDVYAFFYIAAEAKYFSAISERYYVYRYGVGISTKRAYSLEEYSRTLGKFDALRALTDYVNARRGDRDLQDCRDAVAARFTENSFKHIFARLNGAATQRKALMLLRDKCGALDLISHLASKYGSWKNVSDAVSLLANLNAVEPTPVHAIRRVGLLYHHLTPGGVQRVISEAIAGLRRQGLVPVLILEEELDDSCYPIPSDTEVHYVPKSTVKDPALLVERVRGIAKVLSEAKVDVLYSHQFVSQAMIWDILVAKWHLGVPFVLHFHSFFTVALHAFPTANIFLRFNDLALMCDAIICLSRVDAAYFRGLGARAEYVPNPANAELRTAARSDGGRHVGGRILWVGRFAWEKHPLDAVHIFAKVRERHPEATFVMVGSGAPNIVETVQKAVKDLGLEDAVSLPGETNDVYPYYADASVFLTTPAIEGFGMTSLEALSFGLPIVSYSAPQLELYRNNPVVTQVRESDTQAAADALCAYLEQTDLPRLRTLARESVKAFVDADFSKSLAALFDAVARQGGFSREQPSAEDRKIMIAMMANGIKAQQKRNLSKIASLSHAIDASAQQLRKKEVSRLKKISRRYKRLAKAHAAMKKSVSFRIGRLFTWMPRIVRDAVLGRIGKDRENG